MKGFTTIRYGTRFGCRWGQPHDFEQLYDCPSYKVERCKICHERKRWNKGWKGRVANVDYLIAHVRQYAQEGGATRRVFNKLYHPEKTTIVI
jgi:hypothetical protein